jgi:hypothetical protein
MGTIDTIDVQHGAAIAVATTHSIVAQTLMKQGLITSKWGESENKRKAKYYRLSAAGRRRFKEETAYPRRQPARGVRA